MALRFVCGWSKPQFYENGGDFCEAVEKLKTQGAAAQIDNVLVYAGQHYETNISGFLLSNFCFRRIQFERLFIC